MATIGSTRASSLLAAAGRVLAPVSLIGPATCSNSSAVAVAPTRASGCNPAESIAETLNLAGRVGWHRCAWHQLICLRAFCRRWLRHVRALFSARQDDDRRSAWRESSCAPRQASQALRSAGSGIAPCVVSRVAGAVSAIWLGLWSGCVEVGAVRSRA